MEESFARVSLCETMDLARCASDLVKHALEESVYLHPVTFQLVWAPFQIHTSDIGDIEKDEESSSGGQVVDWDTVIFPQARRLTVTSSQTGNPDKRGGGCGNLELPVADFQWSVGCPGGVTLKHLTEGVYRMKGSKYDTWYELFCGLDISTDEDGDIVAKCNFDYGS